MKALVTGGAGFIGSHLVHALMDKGIAVSVIDNLSTGNKNYVPQGIPLYQTDIQSEEARSIITAERPDIVFHHAAQVDVQRSVHDPGYDASVNIAGSANIIQACTQASVQKIVYASSCAVYGDLNTSLIEEQDPTRPVSFYGLSKKTPEIYLRIFHQLYGLQYTILRYANVYGPRQTPKGEGGVISIFMDRLKKNLPLDIFGDGEQTRDFIYVKDVVEANLKAIQLGNGQIIQVGTAVATSVNQLLVNLQNMTGRQINSIYKPERSGDIRHSCLGNTRALECLQWSPSYDLSSGLKETYDYVMSQT
ncbi:UDP-glucose 4-epimerase [compost metagenome]